MSERHSNAGRVIVTYSRSLIALMVAQSLGSRGIDVIGCDDINLTVLSFSKFVSKTCLYTPYSQNEDQFIDDLVAIVEDNKPASGPYVLMPGFVDAAIISKHASRFDGLITLACPPYGAIEKVTPKDHFTRTVQELEVSAPKTWLPDSAEEAEKLTQDAYFPLFLKPPDETGGRGISKTETHADVKAEFENLQARFPDQQLLIQEHADGDDYCFCGLFDRGKLLASMTYTNLQTWPSEAGPGVTRETVDGKKFDAIATQLMKPLEWHGVAEIDFLWNGEENSDPLMIEVNPRFWSGLDHSLKSEVDFPYLLFQLVTGAPVDGPDVPRIGHRTSLPGLSTLSQFEGLMTNAVDFEKLEKVWPDIQEKLSEGELRKAVSLLSKGLDDTFSFDEAFKVFRDMSRKLDKAEPISYADDDPLVGLGFLFIIGSLMKHGKLPPEVSRD